MIEWIGWPAGLEPFFRRAQSAPTPSRCAFLWTHACTFQPLGDAVEISGMPGQTQPDIRDRDSWTNLQESGDAASPFFHSARDDVGWRQETIDPYRCGVLGERTLEPAD